MKDGNSGMTGKAGNPAGSGAAGFFRRIFRKDRLMLLPRLICLFFALVFWIYVVNVTSTNSEKTFTQIPIKVEGAEALGSGSGFAIYDQSESKVSVTVSGKRQDLLDISESGFYAYIDVSGITEGGKHTIPVKLSIPETVSLVSSSPSSIVIYADENTSKTVPVKVEMSSYSMSDKYAFDEIRPAINTVTVSGPAALLSRIAAARAELNLDSAWVTSGFVHNSPLSFVDSAGLPVDSGYISCDVSSVDVAVSVTLSNDVRLTYTLETGFDQARIASVRIEPSVLKVSGAPEKVSQLSKLNVITVGESTPALTVITADGIAALLPDGVEPLGFEGEIKVYVELLPETTSAPPETSSPEVTTSAEESSSPDVTGGETSQFPEDITYPAVTAAP
jgi:YbbR domain-containing protein